MPSIPVQGRIKTAKKGGRKYEGKKEVKEGKRKKGRREEPVG